MKTHRSSDWQDPDAPDGDDLDIFDLPSISPSFFENDRACQPQPKVTVTLQIDRDVLAWFRARGSGWENRIAMALREHVDASQGNAGNSKKPE
jgi:BrnA antitoxin of type II toxin-antitoxin system